MTGSPPYSMELVPADGSHPAITQGELEGLIIELMNMAGEAAPLCQHAAVVLAMMARHIHLMNARNGEQLH